MPLLAAGAADVSFSGRIYDNQGKKQVAEAIVTLTTPSGYIASVTTDKKGEFSFRALPEGEYDFRVTARGYAIYERQVTVLEDGGMRQFDIRLRVPADRQTVSVLELRRPDVARETISYNGDSRRGY